MSLIEEDVVFGLVAHIGGEVFAHNAMPVGAILFVKLFLDMFGHEVLHFDIINCVFGLSI